MIPSSKIKNELKQKMNFSQVKSKIRFSWKCQKEVESVKQNILAPEEQHQVVNNVFFKN